MLLVLLLALLVDQLDSLIEGDGHRIGILRQRGIFLLVQHIGTKAACSDNDGGSLVVTYGARQLEQLQSLVERQRLHAFFARQLGKQRLLNIFSRTNLNHRTKTTNLHEYRLSALGVLTQLTLASLTLLTGIHGLFNHRFEVLIEGFHHVLPLFLTLGYSVEVLLHLSGEVIVHDGGEIFHQEVIDHNTDIGRQQLTLV